MKPSRSVKGINQPRSLVVRTQRKPRSFYLLAKPSLRTFASILADKPQSLNITGLHIPMSMSVELPSPTLLLLYYYHQTPDPWRINYAVHLTATTSSFSQIIDTYGQEVRMVKEVLMRNHYANIDNALQVP